MSTISDLFIVTGMRTSINKDSRSFKLILPILNLSFPESSSSQFPKIFTAKGSSLISFEIKSITFEVTPIFFKAIASRFIALIPFSAT